MKSFWNWVVRVLTYQKCEICKVSFDPYESHNCFEGWSVVKPSMSQVIDCSRDCQNVSYEEIKNSM